MSARVAAFVLTSTDLTGPEMAEAYVKALPRMKGMLVGQPRPFIAQVSASGAVKLILRGAPRWLRRQLSAIGRKRRDAPKVVEPEE